MYRQAGYSTIVLFTAALLTTAGGATTQAQVLDGTSRTLSRCDLYRSLGRALPPECGGSGPSLGGATRGRIRLSAPPAPAARTAPASATAAPQPAPRPAAAQPAVAPTSQPAAPPAAAAATTDVPAPPSAPATKAAPKGVGLPIPFALDSDVLTSQAKGIVDQLAEVFAANGNDRYVIEGHTDVSGAAWYNRLLSERRARSVVRYLVERHGLAADRFTVRGKGSSELLLPNDPRNGRNRRVQILTVDS